MKEKLKDLWWVIDENTNDVDNYFLKTLMREKYSEMPDSRLANKVVGWAKTRMNEAMEAVEEFEMSVKQHKDMDKGKMTEKELDEKYMAYDMMMEMFKKKIKMVSQKIADFKM